MALLDEHHEAVESDLVIHCAGTRLTGLWTGALSWRLLGVLIRGLPTESLTKTAIRDATPEHVLKAPPPPDASYGPWTRESMLLAELIDLARWQQWTKTTAAEQGRNQPDPYPRPGVKRRPATVTSSEPTADVVNIFAYMREHGGALPETAAGKWVEGPSDSA